MPAWVIRLGMVVACAFAGSAVAQDSAVYKWVDKDGTVNYSDQPPAGASAEAMPIRARRGGSPATQARAKAAASTTEGDPATSDEKAPGADEEATDENAGVPADEREKLLAQRQNNCKLAKQRMASYEQARRIYRPGADGERVYLSNEELDSERATARVAVAEWCDE